MQWELNLIARHSTELRFCYSFSGGRNATTFSGNPGIDPAVWRIQVRVPAASLGMLFLEALGISKHVLQISITGTLLLDPQLKGSAQRLMLTKDGYHPAGPLKTRENAALEKLMMSRLDILDCDSGSNSLASTCSGLSDADDDTFPVVADASGLIDGPVVEES